MAASYDRRKKQLLYDVVPVHPVLCAEYRKLNPLHPPLADFVKAVLANPDYSEHHAAVRRTQAFCAKAYPGSPVFVKVGQLP